MVRLWSDRLCDTLAGRGGYGGGDGIGAGADVMGAGRFIRSPLRMVAAMMAGAGDIGVTPGRVRGGGGSSDRPCGNFSTDGSLNVS